MENKRSLEDHRQNLRENFPERLRTLRTSIGISQDAFAKALGVSRAAIGYYESGERLPDIAFLDSVCELTGCDPEYLLARSSHMVNRTFDFADEWDMTDNEVLNLEKLLTSFTFREFIKNDNVVNCFEQLDMSAVVNTYGGDEFARAIVEYKTVTILGTVIGDIFSNHSKQRGSNPNDEWEELAKKHRDEVTTLIDKRLNDPVYIKDVADAEKIRKDMTETLERFVSEKEAREASDPIIQFRNRLLYGNQDKENTNGQETR